MLLANFSFEHEVLFGLSASWFRRVSDVEACLWAECPLGISAVGSDVRLMLRVVCEDGLLFGHFAHWFWLVSTLGLWLGDAIWVFLWVGSVISTLEDSLCWGSVYLGLLTGHYFGGFVIVLSSGVCVYSICGIGILVAFCKLGNSGSIH